MHIQIIIELIDILTLSVRHNTCMLHTSRVSLEDLMRGCYIERYGSFSKTPSGSLKLWRTPDFAYVVLFPYKHILMIKFIN